MAIRVSKNRVALENIPFHQAKAVSLASGSTVDLSTASGNLVHITGSAGPIASFGTVPAGSMFTVIFDSTPTVTYNATSLVLNTGGTSFTASAGDRAMLLSEGGGNWIVSVIKKDGTSLVGSSSSSGIVSVAASRALSASDDGKTVTITASSDVTLTVPAGLPAGFGCAIYQSASGAAIVIGSGATVTPNTTGHTKTGGSGKITALVQTATNAYSFSGGTA